MAHLLPFFLVDVHDLWFSNAGPTIQHTSLGVIPFKGIPPILIDLSETFHFAFCTVNYFGRRG